MEYFLTPYPCPVIAIGELRYPPIDLTSERVKKFVQAMKDHQTLDPIRVDARGEGGKHFVTDGARRVAASKIMGYSRVPAIVVKPGE